MQVIPFNKLGEADLLIDATYEGRLNGNAGDDPLPALLGVSNQGGFRILGSREQPRLVVLTTSMDDPEWPDNLDHETGFSRITAITRNPGVSYTTRLDTATCSSGTCLMRCTLGYVMQFRQSSYSPAPGGIVI
jgi:hypothetical protein